jgi:predicted RNase H-like HicB family nuclease
MIRAREDCGFAIEYPDLPGCSAAAADFREAQRLAPSILAKHLLDLQAQGVPIPEPRNMKELQDSGLAEGAVPLLVPARREETDPTKG